MRMKEDGLKTLMIPLFPNEGCGAPAATKSCTNSPFGTAYPPPDYRNPMATVVYSIPIIPNKEKGARDDKSFNRQRGKITIVTPNRAFSLDIVIPADESRFLKVSVKIMEYAKFAKKQENVLEKAVIQDVDGPTVLSHASRYDDDLVAAQILPINENP